MSKDIPLLNSVIPLEFSAVLAKGRNNYISLRRLKSAIKRADGLFDREEQHYHSAKSIAGAKRHLADRAASSIFA